MTPIVNFAAFSLPASFNFTVTLSSTDIQFPVCLNPSECSAKYDKLTGGPSSPASPFSPEAPAGPRSPASPCLPGGPPSPLTPLGPSLPGGPAGPAGPGLPYMRMK